MANSAVLDTGDRIFAGILMTSLSYFLFSLQDASIKLLVAGFSVWQILFFRSFAVLIGCAMIGGVPLMKASARSPIVLAMLWRSAIILAAWLCYYSAISHLQLAEITTIYFAAPVLVTLLSIPLLGEKVPFFRWAAVLIGFAGVFVACNPTRLGLSVPVALVLAAAFLWGLSVVLLRKLALRERTLIQLVLNNAFFLVMAGVPMLFAWQTPDPAALLLMAGVGLLGGVAQFMLFEGMKRAPVSIIAPFEYTSLIWSFALGYLIWADIPRGEVFVGAALIVAAGLLVLAGEHRRQRTANAVSRPTTD